jgi:hypothetical protein
MKRISLMIALVTVAAWTAVYSRASHAVTPQATSLKKVQVTAQTLGAATNWKKPRMKAPRYSWTKTSL